MRLLVSLLFSVVLAGCAANARGYYTQSVQSWRGSNVSDMVKVWGQPSTVVQNGGSISYVYKQQSRYNKVFRVTKFAIWLPTFLWDKLDQLLGRKELFRFW